MSKAGGSNLILAWDTDAATTRLQVRPKDRNAGMQISYNDPERGWLCEQYIGSQTTDAQWGGSKNWLAQSDRFVDLNMRYSVGSYCVSDMIAVAPGMTLEIYAQNTGSFTSAYYNFDQTKIDNINPSFDGTLFEVPDGCYWIGLAGNGVLTRFALKIRDYDAAAIELAHKAETDRRYRAEVIGEITTNDMLQGYTPVGNHMLTAAKVNWVVANNSGGFGYVALKKGLYAGSGTSVFLLFEPGADVMTDPPIQYFGGDPCTIRVDSDDSILAFNLYAGFGTFSPKLYRSGDIASVYTTSNMMPINGYPFIVNNKSLLKGKNACPDPWLKNGLCGGIANLANSPVIDYPFALENHGLGYATMSEGEYRVKGQITSSADSYARLALGISAQYMRELGWEVGDKIKCGFHIQDLGNGGMRIDETPKTKPLYWTSSTKTFIESKELEIASIHLSVGLTYFVHPYLPKDLTVNFDLRITGVMFKNLTKDGAWLGFEENELAETKAIIKNSLGENIRPTLQSVLDDNKKDIYDAAVPQMYGANLPNIRRKLRTMNTFGKPKSSIRIALFADSIWGSGRLAQKMVTYFNETWGIPTENIDTYSACYGGYEVWGYAPCIDGAVIKPNVDLFIFSDVPYAEVRDQIIAKVRKETNADIMIGTWTIQTPNQRVRYNHVVDLCHKYGCELLDINGILLRKDQDGTDTNYMSGVHPNALGEDLIIEDFKKHFESERYYNEYITTAPISEDIVHLGAEVAMPLNDNITFGGVWSYDDQKTAATCSVTNGYIEVEFDGVGCEMAFARSASAASHTILIDDVAPSTLGLEYCTPMTCSEYNNAWYFHRFFAAYPSGRILNANESEVELSVRIDSVTRGSGDKATSVTYSLMHGSTVIGTGDIMRDCEFDFRSGKIRIPAKVYGWDNWVEMPSGDPNAPGSGYVFTVGQTMTFKIRKTWCDTIDTNATQYFRIAGLQRGHHKIKLLKGNTAETKAKYISIYK